MSLCGALLITLKQYPLEKGDIKRHSTDLPVQVTIACSGYVDIGKGCEFLRAGAL